MRQEKSTVAASVLERLSALELKVQGLESLRQALEWLGATIQGQTEALDIVVEEIAASVDKDLPQKIGANHERRNEARRQAAIQESKNAMKQLIENGILTETDTATDGTMLVGIVTQEVKDEKGETVKNEKGEPVTKVAHEFESGLFQNFPPELQAAVRGKGAGASWDGPRGKFELHKIYAFKRSDAPKVVENLVAQAEKKETDPSEKPAEAPAVETQPTEAPKTEGDGNQQ